MKQRQGGGTSRCPCPCGSLIKSARVADTGKELPVDCRRLRPMARASCVKAARTNTRAVNHHNILWVRNLAVMSLQGYMPAERWNEQHKLHLAPRRRLTASRLMPGFHVAGKGAGARSSHSRQGAGCGAPVIGPRLHIQASNRVMTFVVRPLSIVASARLYPRDAVEIAPAVARCCAPALFPASE